MTATNRKHRTSFAALGLALSLSPLLALAPGSARAERRPPFGADSALLEARVREDIERRVGPLLEQMAPGQAELKYVDVRVTRPTALPSGAAPGFEELSPAAEFVAEKAEVALTLDAKLPAPFRKDLKNLIKNRLDGLSVPIDIKETVIAFPAPRPQPPTPREMPFAYPPMPQPQAPAAQPAAPVAAAPPAAPVEPPGPRAIPWPLALAVAVLAALVGALAVALVVVLAGRRASRRAAAGPGETKPEGAGGKEDAPALAAPAVDHLPDVRRALREDRVLARRVMGELLRENQLDKVALAVELVGPSVVEDLRGDPACATQLREAAALLVEGRPRGDTREIVAQLHRRILKHRMVGAEDKVEQEFSFLLGLSPARLAAVLGSEPPAVQAAGLRYAPVHLRTAYLAERSAGERSALAAALASPKALTKEHLLDVAATLRARAADQAHIDSGETGDLDLAVELIEERPVGEQTDILEAMRRADPAKARAVQAALIGDATFEQVSDELLVASAMAVSTEVLARYLRVASEGVASRTLAALPRTVAASLEEDLSLEVAPSPRETGEARRAMFASLRRALRERGLSAPSAAPAGAETGTGTGTGTGKGKVVAL